MQYGSLFLCLMKLNNSDKKITQTKIAEILGLSKQGINSRITRKQDFTEKEIIQICQYYGINPEDFCISEESADLVNLSTLRGSCGGGCQVSENLIPKYDKGAVYSIVEAVGDSMGATVPDGSKCIVKHYQGEQIKDGAIYFFSVGDDYFIKRLSKNINEILITSDNSAYPPITLKGDEVEKLKIYGEVIKNMRDY